MRLTFAESVVLAHLCREAADDIDDGSDTLAQGEAEWMLRLAVKLDEEADKICGQIGRDSHTQGETT